jgi:hypothetical protein
MTQIFKIIPVVLYLFVGIVCLIMAFKTLFATKFLPFHEKASGKLWDEIESPMKLLILSYLRLIGLGFLIVALLLIVFPIVNYFNPNEFYIFAIPFLALIFCSGLCFVNYNLYKKTNANTPWKGSIYAMIVIIAGIIISILV